MTTNNYDYSTQFRNAIRTAIQPWVEWKHIPMGILHCPTCLKLDKCWFVKANMPMLPQHEKCHCTAVPISTQTVQQQATADSKYSKFDPFLFDTNGKYNHGKEVIFHSAGYSVADSLWLKEEVERQGLEKYKAGDYILNKLDHDGQRVNIVVKIPRKDREGELSFTTGWVAYPNGHIQLATPYGDK